MNKVKVITDSCADMGKELRDRFDVDYVRMTVKWGKDEKYASTDWDLYTVKEFYDAMRGGEVITTQQVAAPEFERVFSVYLDEGYDIVYVACSSALSGSYNLGQVVAKSFADKYPDRKIICVDPKNSSAGEALIAIAAAQKAASGASAEEVAEHALSFVPNTLQFCTADSLTYLKRAGRVKASAAFFGNLFGIKPIIISNDKGENEAIKKIKGKRNAQDECVRLLKASIEAGDVPASEQTIFVVDADNKEDSEYLVERVKTLIEPKEIIVGTIGPIIGASIGPGAVALFGMGNPDAARNN